MSDHKSSTHIHWPIAGLVFHGWIINDQRPIFTAQVPNESNLVKFPAFPRPPCSKNMDLRGFDPRTSRMQSERTTNCSTNPSVYSRFNRYYVEPEKAMQKRFWNAYSSIEEWSSSPLAAYNDSYVEFEESKSRSRIDCLSFGTIA